MNIKVLIQKFIDQKQFSAAEILMARKGRMIFHEKFGQGKFFDLASLTKPLCTAFLMLLSTQARTNGQPPLLSLEDPVEKFFPTKTLQGVSLKSLLNHTSPLVAWVDLTKKNWKDLLYNPTCLRKGKQTFYSDLGYIVFGKVLEKACQTNLKNLFFKKIAKPLHLEDEIFFCPGKTKKSQCVKSEKNRQGIVQDRNAATLGGACGHAGLFGTAKAIHKILQEFRKASFGKSKLILKKSFFTFCKPDPKRKTSQRMFTLGFDTPTKPGSLSGRYFSKNSIGHLGYTGTSFWWDLNKDVWIILLTNRLYFQGHPKNFRPKIHDALMKSP